ncbi:MAG: nitroreductase [Candidatus Kaiserbacteria bacterium]|nr:nitroreductase [Candidatus Kaiserbacteria bacterium]
MTSFISKLHTDLRLTRITHRGAPTDRSATPGMHKEYPRMERIALSAPVTGLPPLDEVLAKRHSSETTASPTALSLSDISTLTGHALGKHADSAHRNYPSGGALYPIETYIIASQLKDAGGGVYHYHPTEHALEKLWDLPPGFAMPELVPKPESPAASTIILFTSVWDRSSRKYGDFTYPLALQEAGHMSQNILLVATALGIAARPIAGFNDACAEKLLDIQDAEQPVLSIVLYRNA